MFDLKIDWLQLLLSCICMPQPENMYMNHDENKYLCIYESEQQMLEFFFHFFVAFSLK